MKKVFATLVLMLSFCWAHAQLYPQFTNFAHNRHVLNPSVAGSEEYVDIMALYRAQWVGIEGAPSTQSLSAHMPIYRINSGIGLMVVNDMLGAQRTTTIHASYAYRFKFRFGNLAAGLGAGFFQKAIDGTKLRSPEGIYTGGIDHQDNYIPNQKVSGLAPDLSVGLYFNNKKVYAGVSMNNLLGSKVTVNGQGASAQIRTPRSLNFSAGYTFELNRNLSLQPNVLAQSDFNTFQTSVNVILYYKDNIYGGLAFRGSTANNIDGLSALFGLRLVKQLHIGYSYDFSLSKLNQVNTGSHEVFARYIINIKDGSKPGKIIYNPRFL
ncbi:type IX secretion system membrane protein PorP/SprF [soil metagenome]